MRRKTFMSAAVLTFLPAVALAQAAENSRRFGLIPTWGVLVGQPTGASLSGGLIIGALPSDQVRYPFASSARGALVQLEPGVGGGKMSLGWGSGNPPLFGEAVKLSAVRTWGKPWGMSRGSTCVGPELELGAWGGRASVGWLWRTHSRHRHKGTLTWDLGIGF